jgi:hypothetical protein
MSAAQTLELVARDDHFVHTGPYPLSGPAHVAMDPRAFERHWNVWHDDVGELLLAVGGTWYPNLGRMEAYAIANHRGDHRSVRAFRPASDETGPDGAHFDLGPLTSTVESGLRRWHHTLADGEWGFSYDLSWVDTRRQVYAAAWGPEVETGERQVTAGFEGFGTLEGWVQVGDRRIEWTPESAHGTRDRHWGIGRGVGGPALNGGRAHRPGWKGGIWIDLHDVGVWGKQLLYGFDDDRPGSGRVREVSRRLRFEEDTRVFVEGVIDLTFDDGTRRSLHLERVGAQTAFMRCGFYGGTPDSGLHPGQYAGPANVEWDRFDVTDPAVRLRLRGLDEHHCRVTYEGRQTTGILQPVEPDVYEACRDGAPGWGLL